MLFYKCWKSIMKTMSPLGVGLILFGLFGGLSGTYLTTPSPFLPDSSLFSKSYEEHLSQHSSEEEILSQSIPQLRTTARFFPRKISLSHQVFKKATAAPPVPEFLSELSIPRSSFSRAVEEDSRKISNIPMVVYEVIYPDADYRSSSRRKTERNRSRVRRPKVKWRPKIKPSTGVSNIETESNIPFSKLKNRKNDSSLASTTESYLPKVIKKIQRKAAFSSQPFQLKSANGSLSTNHFNSSQKINLSLSSNVSHLPNQTYRTSFLYQNTRRKGRKFNTDFITSREDGETEVKRPSLFRLAPSNETLKHDPSTPLDKLFNYTYNISALERGSLYQHDPLGISEPEGVTQSYSYNISSIRKKQEKDLNPKNVTIYELLKPRLRTTTESINLWKFGLSRGKGTLKFSISDKIENNDKLSKVDSSTSLVKITSSPPSNLHDKTLTDDSNADSVGRTVTNGSDLELSANKVLVSNSNFNAPFILNDTTPASQSSSNSLLSRKVPNIPSNINNPSTEINRTLLSSLTPRTKKPVLETTTAIFEESRNIKEIIPPIILNRVKTNDTSRNYVKLPILKSTKFAIKLKPVSVKPVEASTAANLPDSDSIREAKMADTENYDNIAIKRPRLDQKAFYDRLMKIYSNYSALNDSTIPEFKPGSFFHYSDIYRREPVLGVGITRPDPFFRVRTQTTPTITTEFVTTPTTFESRRTSVRVMSTFYPNRMRDVTMRFGNVPEPTTTLSSSFDSNLDHRSEEELDDAEYRDALDPGFTMEKLAFLLIGTCCGLSILCLCVVVIAIKCRRVFMEKKLKEHFRRRMYQHETMKEATNPWQQQLFDHFMYLNRHPESSRSSAHSCNCHCVTWSLGARNLDIPRQLRGANRGSLFLNSQKKLPFGAASTLRYESMLGRKRGPPGMSRGGKNEAHLPTSSPEHDSLEQPDSDSQDSNGSKHCTCIDYTLWPVSTDVLRGMNRLCPTAGRYVAGDCTHHVPMDDRPLPRDCPPPVTGSNYLDRSEGVVYWSSNNERLI